MLTSNSKTEFARTSNLSESDFKLLISEGGTYGVVPVFCRYSSRIG